MASLTLSDQWRRIVPSKEAEGIAARPVRSAAREFLKVAGGLQPALDLVSDLVSTLTGACGVAITLLPNRATSQDGRNASTYANKRIMPALTIHSVMNQLQPVRCTVIAPLYHQQEIIVHLEMFFAEPAFDEQDMRALRGFAALLAEMIRIHTAESKRIERGTAKILGRIDNLLRWPTALRPQGFPRIKLHLR